MDDKVEKSRAWPKTASHLSARLKRLAPALRAEGIAYEDWREAGGSRRRKKRLSRLHPPDGGRDGGGTPPDGTPREDRPTLAPPPDAPQGQEGRSGTIRDDAPHPYSADNDSAESGPEDVTQGPAAPSQEKSPRESPPGATLFHMGGDQNKDAEERPGSSLR